MSTVDETAPAEDAGVAGAVGAVDSTSVIAERNEIDGFLIGPKIHSGAMARIHSVTYADGRPSPFPMIMKVPRMTPGDGGETIVGFEVEQQIMPVLHGSHVPRFVAAGDLTRLPYLVMEYIPSHTLEQCIAEYQDAKRVMPVERIAQLGEALAEAVHSLHQQDTCHLDLKPANVLIVEAGQGGVAAADAVAAVADAADAAAEHLQGAPGSQAGKAVRAVLLDFGLSCHAGLPDLHAEEMRKAVGSPAWIAPEQVVGVRGDPRSDIFAVGVMLYEMATNELPFGAPTTDGGMRQRLWMDPRPPRALRADLPEWLQEVILRCLAPRAADRYPSAAHLAFDLRYPDQVVITARGRGVKRLGFWPHFKRWIRAAGMSYQPSPPPMQQIEQVPIVMVAVPHWDTTDATLFTLRAAVARSLGTRPGARLAVVTVIKSGEISTTDAARSETALHRHHLARLKQWSLGLDLAGHQPSFHVLESSDVAEALLEYARGNQVSLLILGAATHGLKAQRFVATVPIKVAMSAPCTVILVKEPLPFEQLARVSEEDEEVAEQ